MAAVAKMAHYAVLLLHIICMAEEAVERASEAKGSGRKNAFVTYRDMFIVRKDNISRVPYAEYCLFPNHLYTN